MRIHHLTEAPPVVLAAAELGEYLGRMTGENTTVVPRDSYDPDDDALWVGTDAGLPVETPTVEDPEWDDGITVETEGTTGVVAGTNPRAALLGTYRYLRALGCRWVRPGPDGEIVPERRELPPLSVSETPDHRYRGISVGGGADEGRLRALIEWAPRVGYNAAMIEFSEGELFEKGRDRRRDHPTVPDEPLSEKRALELHEAAVDAIERRGLSYHAVGHNWTAAVLGMADSPREDDDDAVPDERREYLAEVDGERSLFRQGPVDTELCYSRTAVRERFADAVVEYAADHREVDVLHVWLSDGNNNHCECADCRGTRPADYYVEMLNRIDGRLTDRDIDTRVAFLAYTDLLWPPVEKQIENEDRFALMFAPIDRSYDADWSVADPDGIPDYERNDLSFPRDLSENVAFLAAWREVFGGDGFVFDYHYWRAQFRDPGGIGLAGTAAADARALCDIGLDGSVSCNLRRAFFPHGLGMVGTAEALYDRDRAFDETVTAYADAAYGTDGDAAMEYLRELSESVEERWLREGTRGPAVADAFASVRKTVAVFEGTIECNRERTAGTRARSWDLLAEHAEIQTTLAAALEARARGEDDAARERWAALTDRLAERTELTPVLDVYLFESTFRELFEAD